MSAEIVERVARAIVTADEQNGGPPWDVVMGMGKHVTGPVYDRARAALAALREPTAAMLVAAIGPDAHFERPVDLRPAWHRAIDAALAEDTP